MKKDLVVFYSRSGVTRQLAQRLARALDADLDEIREPRDRGGILGYLRSGYEAARAIAPPLLEPRHHPRPYHRVFIGTPVWAGHVSSPVRAYLTLHRQDLRHVAFFCTYNHAGADTALAEMERILGRAPLARATVPSREAREGRDEHVAPFLKTLLAHA